MSKWSPPPPAVSLPPGFRAEVGGFTSCAFEDSSPACASPTEVSAAGSRGALAFLKVLVPGPGPAAFSSKGRGSGMGTEVMRAGT